MASSRTAVRSMRALAARSALRGTHRYSTTNPQSSPAAAGSSAVVGGLVGGAVVLGVSYGYYRFSGAKAAVDATRQAKAYVNQGAKKLQNATPEPSEALRWLRETSVSYASMIPGAKTYVNAAFDDIDKIHDKHGEKVDTEVKEAYKQLAKVSQEKGLSVEAAQEAGQILEKLVKNLSTLAGDAASDIMNSYPQLKEKVGGNLDQLKALGDKYGPEAKKQVDRTWEQIQDVVRGGVSDESISRIQKIVQEKKELLKKIGDNVWQNGMEQARPFLEKNPVAKELVEQNADDLKQGNVDELWEKVKEATESGNTDNLEKYVKSAADRVQSKGKEAGEGLSNYSNMIPGAGELAPKLIQLKEIGEKHGKEAETLVKETLEEIQQVLEKKLREAEKLAAKAKKDGE